MSNDDDLKGTILIVDDEPRNRRIVEKILKSFSLETAGNGIEALEKIERVCPDIVLLDIMMPEMDGYEVCRRIRSDERFRFTKILFVSGKAMVQERLAGYEAGGDDYVTKPFNHDELLAKVDVFLRLKHTEEVSQIKSDFLQLISHETRTPLTGILGLSEIIASDPDIRREELVDYATRISSSGNRLLSFIEKALLLCQLKADPQLLVRESSLTEVVQAAEQSLGEGCCARLGVDLASELFECDPELMSQALSCVVGNAIRLSPEGIPVEVRGSRVEDHIEISVADRGPGIAPERLEDIFSEFAVEDVDHHGEGQGLSLAIARRIARLHGGELLVESQLGVGSTFSFRIPVSCRAAKSEELTDAQSAT